MTTPRVLTHRAVAIGTALTLVAGAAAPLAGAASSPAATLMSKTVRHAGQIAPVAVPGNHLHAGQTIRKGYQLYRYTVRVNGKQPLNFKLQKPITLHAPKGYVITGLALGTSAKLGFAVHSDYNRSTLKTAFYMSPKADGSTGSTYMLVKKS